MPFLLALHFLTILPLPQTLKVKDNDLARSVGYFPLIGVMLGVLSAGVYVIAFRWTGLVPALMTSVISTIILSGALHLDGFADLCDAFYAGKNKEHILAIMKDSHVGAMAVVGLICLLALKFTFLSAV